MESILIFGGSGCLGKHLIDKYLGKYRIINFSRDEHKHWGLDKDIGVGKIQHVIGDAIDPTSVKQTLLKYQPSMVFILHALKHVDRCQENLHACIQTNLLSVKNVLDCIHECSYQLPHLKKVLFTSTDKAPSPINVYGMCKAICEELMIEKARFLESIKFVIVRYGNVLNSTASLLPSLVRNTSEIYYITDVRMTRFWMTIEQACQTIQYALEHGQSGEVIIPKLRSFYIKDLIEYVAKLKNKEVKIMGLRPGERLYETLINDTQSIRTIDKGAYYHIQPFYTKYVLTEPFIYDSNTDLIVDSNELISEFKKMGIE
jgi:UDP-N-acetylglucosamine 4,6-dehydratase